VLPDPNSGDYGSVHVIFLSVLKVVSSHMPIEGYENCSHLSFKKEMESQPVV
jgi:hypothetical protein